MDASQRGVATLVLLVVVLAAQPVTTGYSWGQPSKNWREPEQHGVPPPSFEPTDTSITGLAGQTVYLPCRVKHLGDKVVSWIRTRDLHILTSGILTYTSDNRFEVLHGNDPEVWTMRLVGVQLKDEGRYECQVNTDPKLSLPVFLTVREHSMGDSPYLSGRHEPPRRWPLDHDTPTGPSAKILGPSEQIVREGSTVTITCESPPPSLVLSRGTTMLDWLHAGRLISLHAERGGFSLVIDRTDSLVVSRLTVASVTQADSGNYTCRPLGVRPATVQLVVVQGEHTEAMQGDGAVSSEAYSDSLNFPSFLTTFLCSALLWILCRTTTVVES